MTDVIKVEGRYLFRFLYNLGQMQTEKPNYGGDNYGRYQPN